MSTPLTTRTVVVPWVMAQDYGTQITVRLVKESVPGGSDLEDTAVRKNLKYLTRAGFLAEETRFVEGRKRNIYTRVKQEHEL